MKTSPNAIQGFLRNTPPNINSVLIYGPDLGIVKQRAGELSKHIVADVANVFNVDKFYYDKIKSDISKIADAAYATSFLRTRKLIIISDVPNSLPADLLKLLENYSGNNFILLTASELTPASNVRRLYEKAENKAIIACYHDEQSSLRSFITDYLRAHNLSFSASVINQLERNLTKDRMIIINELDKLITYLGISTEINQIDLDMVINENSEVSIDELVESVALKNIVKISSTFENLLAENTSMVTILRSLTRHFIRLYQVKIEVEKGNNETAALKTLSPNLFYKQVPAFLQSLHKWSKNQLIEMLELLAYLESSCKKPNMPANLLCEKLIIGFNSVEK